MIDRIELSILDKNSIVIGQNLFEFIANDLKKILGNICRTYVIITDNYVSSIYLESFSSTLRKALLPIEKGNSRTQRLLTYIVPSGELSKSRETKAQIEDFLSVEECNRDTCIIALGGGVIGDLAGFIASTYNRGVMFVQVPTTLLAMVDSSIGGKNGVDTKFGKNLIGTIYQPLRIYIDCNFLLTLPQREFYNGMAEIIKTSAINSIQEFEFLEENVDEMVRFIQSQNQNEQSSDWSKNEQVLQKLISIITSSVKFKARIVSMDCKDNGIRNLLNFGHTIGHGIELYMAPILLHGECVSIGMVLESKLAVALDVLKLENLTRLTSLLRKFQLPTSLQDEIIKLKTSTKLPPISKHDILRAIKLDKKNVGGRIQVVLLKEIGVPYKLCAVPVDESKMLSELNKLEAEHLKINSSGGSRDTYNTDPSVVLIGEDVIRIQSFAKLLSVRLNYELKSLKNNEDLINYADQNLTETVFHVAAKFEEVQSQFNQLWKNKFRRMVIHVINISLPKDEQMYEENSDFTFVMLPENHAQQIDQFIHLMQYGSGYLYKTILPSLDCRSFFLTLLVPDLCDILSELTSMTNGVHAIEIRVDKLIYNKLSHINIRELCLNIATQITMLRRITLIPLIYTLRKNSEGGYLPDNTESEILKAFYTLGIRLGCEILDIEAVSKSTTHTDNLIQPILNKVREKSRIIASYHHIAKPLDWGGPTSYNYLDQCSLIGDIIKVVSLAKSPKDNRHLEEFLEDYKNSRQKQKIIALNIGRLGQVSRINNTYLTPVTSDKLEPGIGLNQLTIKEVLTGATLMGAIFPKRFFLIGSTISHSISPLVHNMIFNYFGFPYTYNLFETTDLSNTIEMIRSSEFGGASVTMPFKESILTLLDSVSKSAEKISAVNTIIVQSDGKLYGDNTDYLGIKHCIQRNLVSKPQAAICFGAGGTAMAAIYALHSLGVENIYIHNRTTARLDKVIEQFPYITTIINVSDLVSLPVPPTIIVDTTPNHSTICNNAVTNSILKIHNGNGIYLKLAYQGLSRNPVNDESEALHHNTKMIFGEEILIEQALWQNYYWTGLKMNSQFLRDQIFNIMKQI